jgi:hypothetical protein
MPSTGWFRAKGVRGKALVAPAPDGLSITGEKGGNLRVLYTQVERMRSGWQDTKYGRFHETHVWLSGEEKPLKLTWHGRNWGAYAAAVRGFGRRVATLGLAKVWRGTSKVSAVLLLVLITPLFLASVAVGIFALGSSEWWQRILPSIAPAALVVVGYFVAKQSWPRPVKDLAEFDAAVAKDAKRR